MSAAVIGGQQIQVAIAIHVAQHGVRGGGEIRVVGDRAAKLALAVTQAHAHVLVEVTREQIQVPIAVDVAHGKCIRGDAHRHDGSEAEGALPIVDVQPDRTRAAASTRQVAAIPVSNSARGT